MDENVIEVIRFVEPVEFNTELKNSIAIGAAVTITGFLVTTGLKILSAKVNAKLEARKLAVATPETTEE